MLLYPSKPFPLLFCCGTHWQIQGAHGAMFINSCQVAQPSQWLRYPSAVIWGLITAVSKHLCHLNRCTAYGCSTVSSFFCVWKTAIDVYQHRGHENCFPGSISIRFPLFICGLLFTILFCLFLQYILGSKYVCAVIVCQTVSVWACQSGWEPFFLALRSQKYGFLSMSEVISDVNSLRSQW